MNLRTKVLLPFVLIGLAILLFLYGYWMPRHIADLKYQYRQSSERHLVSVMEGLVPLLLAHQLDAVYENLDALKKRNTNWLSIRLLAPDGKTIYPLLPAPPPANGREIHVLEQPIHFQDIDLGRLSVDVDFDEPLKDMRIRHRQLFIMTCIIMLASIGLLWLVIERMISRPVTNLALASKRIAEGDFAAPLPPPRTDEVGELITSFDQMRSSIDRYQAELIKRNESLMKLSHAVEQSPVSIIITDRKGLIEFVNPRFSEVTGYAPEEMLGKNVSVLKTEDASGPSFETIWGAVSTGNIWRGEFRSTRKNGEIFWQSASLSSVRNEAGEMTHTFALLEDISERRALEDQLRQAQKMEAVGLLTGGIAHDFNNILAAITGYGGIIHYKLPPNDALRCHVDEILHAAERGAALTRTLLAFSRKQIVSPKTVDVNKLIKNMTGMLFRLIREDIEFRTILQDGPLSVFIDQGQLEQVLVNLVTNARDAMPNGGTLIIETGSTLLGEQFLKKHGEVAEGNHVVISVSDTGIGMDRETQERIYEPFFTTKNLGKGTGLGLSTVYSIVKQNNGHINCYSVPSNGTTFRIYFPFVASRDTQDQPVHLPELKKGRETILMAEDNEPVRKFTRTILQEAGYTVLVAENGEEALAIFRQKPDAVDLMLFDVIMPKMNGREAYEEIHRVRPDIKVLFTSGYTAELIEQKGILSGGLNFISKPCRPDDLLRKIREILDSSAPPSAPPN